MEDIFDCREEFLEYTDGQRAALTKIAEFVKSEEKYFLLSGKAGTGKTSIVENIINYTHGVVLAPTNAAVLRLVQKIPLLNDFLTIHKCIYGAPDEKTGEWTPQKIDFGVTYIIDESSMIDSDVLKDLLSLSFTYNIFIGDGFQLPPISKDPELFLWEKSPSFSNYFNEENKYELTEVKRNDAEILISANYIRENVYPEVLNFDSDTLKVVDKFGIELYNDVISNADYKVICSTNKNRMQYNKSIRAVRYNENELFNNVINNNELVISVSNNSKLNGEMFNILEPVIVNTWLDYPVNAGTIKYPKEKFFDFYHVLDEKTQNNYLFIPNLDIPSLHGQQLLEAFNDYKLFWKELKGKKKWNKLINIVTYAYCITCHKAQGTEFENVYVSPDYLVDDTEMAARWLYTAMTRAKTKVRIKDSKFIKVKEQK